VELSSLAASGAEVLARALSHPGRDRSAAFELLAADALLTYACEEAAREEDVEGALAAILRRVEEGIRP
jgi:hypothetical protein